MKYFLLNGSDTGKMKPGPHLKKYLDAHHEYWESQFEAGNVLFGGPKKAGSGLLVIKCESEEAAKELTANDPFVTEGIQTYEVSEFSMFNCNESVKGWFN